MESIRKEQWHHLKGAKRSDSWSISRSHPGLTQWSRIAGCGLAAYFLVELDKKRSASVA